MSKKSELVADLGRIGAQLGGAHLTREARDLTFRGFADAMRAAGFGIRSADQIGGRHLKSFVAARLREGINPRTLANQMSHLRAVLEHTGKSGLARNQSTAIAPWVSARAHASAPRRRCRNRS